MRIENIVSLLDNSQDAETIALEIVSNKKLNAALDDAFAYFDYGMAYGSVANEIYRDFIRELWDVAYNYGYADGFTEAEEGGI